MPESPPPRFTPSLQKQLGPAYVGSPSLLGCMYQLFWRAEPRQEGSPFLGHPEGWGPWDGDREIVSCLLPWSVVWHLLTLKGPLEPVLLLPSSSSHHLSPGPRCEFSLGPGPLSPRGPRTPGVPLHHQLYAGRAHHSHTHLHHLLHDSCTAPGTDWQGHGGGGPGLPCRDGKGGPGLAQKESSNSFSVTVWPVNTGQGLRRTGCSSSKVTTMLCDFCSVVLLL